MNFNAIPLWNPASFRSEKVLPKFGLLHTWQSIDIIEKRLNRLICNIRAGKNNTYITFVKGRGRPFLRVEEKKLWNANIFFLMISIEPFVGKLSNPPANPNLTLTIVRLPCLLVDPSTSQQFQQNQYCLREAAKKKIFS